MEPLARRSKSLTKNTNIWYQNRQSCHQQIRQPILLLPQNIRLFKNQLKKWKCPSTMAILMEELPIQNSFWHPLCWHLACQNPNSVLKKSKKIKLCTHKKKISKWIFKLQFGQYNEHIQMHFKKFCPYIFSFSLAISCLYLLSLWPKMFKFQFFLVLPKNLTSSDSGYLDVHNK